MKRVQNLCLSGFLLLCAVCSAIVIFLYPQIQFSSVTDFDEVNYELKESDSTVFCMDYAMNGIGSNSCGPDVLDKYRFAEEAFQFQFELIPFVKG